MGDYEHEVLIWSRPRWRFAYFAAMGKVGRRPQAAELPAPNLYKEKPSVESKAAHRPLKRAVCPLPGQPAQGQYPRGTRGGPLSAARFPA